MELMQWLTGTPVGEFVFTMLVSVIPVAELRVGLPFGVGLGLSYPAAFSAAVLGNVLPVPFIVIYIRRIFRWMRRHMPRLDRTVGALEEKARRKGRRVERYQFFGLFLLVAIPLPGTGAWMGALVAAVLDMPLRRALPSIFLGVLTAGFLMIGLTHLGVNLFSTALG